MVVERGFYRKIADFLTVHGYAFTTLGRKQKWEIQRDWRRQFSAGVNDATGKWVYKGKDWHAFSYGFTPCLKGARAEAAYDALTAESFLLLSSNEDVPAFKCETGPPKLSALESLAMEHPSLLDLYISSPQFSWTFVLTHEAIGPFFALSG